MPDGTPARFCELLGVDISGTQSIHIIRFSAGMVNISQCDTIVLFFFLSVTVLKIHDVSYRGRLEPLGACVRRSVSVIEGCRVLPTTDGVGGSVLVDQCRLNGHRILERRRRQ